MRRITALRHILVELGLTVTAARHIEKSLDRQRLANLAADDFAELFYRFRANATKEEMERQHRNWEGIRVGLLDIAGQIELPF
jgi:hypothetical protein